MGARGTDKVIIIHVSILDTEREGFILNASEWILLESKSEYSVWQ